MLVAIAGSFPGLTAAQLLAPQPLPLPAAGQWNYHRLVADALPTGFVAIPGTTLSEAHPNIVAVVCTGTSMGIEFADGSDHEVLALIDRDHDPSEFSPNDFYAFADADDNVQIRWIKELPAGWRILGRLLYTQLPYVKKPGEGGGFAELSDDFEF